MKNASKRAGWGFWLLWVAASTVGFALGSIAHGNAGKLLNDATPAVIATIVTVGLYPLIATLPGFLHWLILRRWFPHAGWWVLVSGAGSLVGYYRSMASLEYLPRAETLRLAVVRSVPGLALFFVRLGVRAEDERHTATG